MVDPQITEVMGYLAENYMWGIIICCAVVVVIYLLFSIRLLFTSRDVGMRLYVSAFIPVLNVLLWVVKCIKMLVSGRESTETSTDDKKSKSSKRKKSKKKKKGKEASEDDDFEFYL